MIIQSVHSPIHMNIAIIVGLQTLPTTSQYRHRQSRISNIFKAVTSCDGFSFSPISIGFLFSNDNNHK